MDKIKTNYVDEARRRLSQIKDVSESLENKRKQELDAIRKAKSKEFWNTIFKKCSFILNWYSIHKAKSKEKYLSRIIKYPKIYISDLYSEYFNFHLFPTIQTRVAISWDSGKIKVFVEGNDENRPYSDWNNIHYSFDSGSKNKPSDKHPAYLVKPSLTKREVWLGITLEEKVSVYIHTLENWCKDFNQRYALYCQSKGMNEKQELNPKKYMGKKCVAELAKNLNVAAST